MSEFCEKCSKLLSKITTSTDAYFLCSICGDKKYLTKDNFILHTENKNEIDLSHLIAINQIALNELNPYTDEKCPKCEKQTVKMIILTEDQNHYYQCASCMEHIVIE